MFLDVPRTGVDVSEDTLGRQELVHGLAHKVGHDQQERLGDVDGLRLEVVDLSEDGSEAGETETEEEGSKGNGGKTGIVVGRQDLDRYVVVVSDGVFLRIGRTSKLARRSGETRWITPERLDSPLWLRYPSGFAPPWRGHRRGGPHRRER